MALCFSPSVALAATKTYSSSGTASVASADTAKKQKIDVNNLTLTNDLIVDFADSTAVVANSKTGVTIINNGTIMNTDDGLRDYAVKAQSGTDFTLTNSGTIAAADSYAVDINQSSGSTITNNAGGIIKAKRWAVNGTDATTSNATVTNSGKIYITSANAAIQFTSATGTTITNNPGGEIYRDSSASGNNPAVKIGVSSSLTNSGEIRDDGVDDRAIMVTGNNTTVTNNIEGLIGGEFKIDTGITGVTFTNSGTLKAASTSGEAIKIDGSNNTVILKDDGIVVGTITATSGTTGNKLQLQHGFGRAYFYETSGDLTLEDLSGNTVVKGSAGSVGLGGQETVDELLGLRTYNLRSALKRYASAPKPTDKDTVWGEMFGYSSKRGGSDTLLKYETHGYGMNFIHPATSKLDFVLSVEKNELDLPENHDVSRTGFLAGFNASFASFGHWKVSGFALAGMGWYDSSREILTNTQAFGLLDVTSDYETTEVITGGHLSHTYQSQTSGSIKNTWETEIGLTMGYSRTADYNERHYFFWEERNLVQGSIHIGEQLTTNFNDRLRFTLGAELEHRTVLAGRKQTYRINHAAVDHRHGSFYENSVAGNLGLNYSFIDHKAGCNVYEGFCGGSFYIQLNSRLSDETRGTYGGGVGVRLNF